MCILCHGLPLVCLYDTIIVPEGAYVKDFLSTLMYHFYFGYYLKNQAVYAYI